MKPIKYLRIASDLHLEWIRDASLHKYILPEDTLDEYSCLVLAGDIGSGKPRTKFLELMCTRFPKVVYIAGNHEYYGSQGYEVEVKRLRRELDGMPNLFSNVGGLVDIDIPGKRNASILATTLWTDCDGSDPLAMLRVNAGLVDYRAIPGFTVERSIELHQAERRSLETALIAAETLCPKDIRIVVTHHMPSFQLIHERFLGPNNINGAFASNLDYLFEKDYAPHIWIYGHTHDHSVRRINETLTVCNPKGYPGESTGFNERFFIDLDTLLPLA